MSKKVKVSVITILDNINYGTILQAYALGTELNKRKCCVEFVDYYRYGSSVFFQTLTILKDKKRSVLKRILYATGCLILVPIIKKRLRFYLKSVFTLTKAYYSYDDLLHNPPIADLYMVGSDQVWNSTYNNGVDKSFFLGYTAGPKVSYAASIGCDKFDENEIDVIRTLLSSFSHISVREFCSVKLLNSIGLEKVEAVLDPTFLLTKEEWMNGIEYNFVKKERFLLIYSVENSKHELVVAQAEEIARAKKLKLYLITPSDPWKLKKMKVDKIFSFASIPCFLKLVSLADFLVVSSFHGTAFSVIFNKQFLTIIPEAFNIRIDNLLELLNLQDYCITGAIRRSTEYKDIDYSTVNLYLEKMKVNSMAYIDKILK